MKLLTFISLVFLSNTTSGMNIRTIKDNVSLAKDIMQELASHCSQSTFEGLQHIIYEYIATEAEINRLKVLYTKIDAGIAISAAEKAEFYELLKKVKDSKDSIDETQNETLEASEATAGLIS